MSRTDCQLARIPAVEHPAARATTERIDGGEKLASDRQTPSLVECAIAEQSRRHLEVYRRRNAWDCETIDPDHPLVLECLSLTSNVSDIYGEIELDEPRPSDT